MKFSTAFATIALCVGAAHAVAVSAPGGVSAEGHLDRRGLSSSQLLAIAKSVKYTYGLKPAFVEAMASQLSDDYSRSEALSTAEKYWSKVQ